MSIITRILSHEVMRIFLRIEIFLFRVFSNVEEMTKSDYRKISELHLTLYSTPPSMDILSNRVYSNLKSLSFTSELLNSQTYTADEIFTNLRQICSSAALNSIKRVYLYNQIYPKDFRKKENQCL